MTRRSFITLIGFAAGSILAGLYSLKKLLNLDLLGFLDPDRRLQEKTGVKHEYALCGSERKYSEVASHIYESKNGTARYKDGTLIGTALGLSQLLGKLATFTDCPLDAVIKMVTKNPAKLLGLEDRKGSIAPGKDADLVMLDRDSSIYTTIVGGKIVFQR